MLNPRYIKNNKDEVVKKLAIKNFNNTTLIDETIEVFDKRNAIQSELDASLAQMNKLSKEIGMLFKQGKAEEANQAKAQTADLKEKNKDLSSQLSELDKKLNELLCNIPNVPHDSVPSGNSEADNVTVKEGDIAFPELEENLPHWDLAKKFDIIDFDLGSKITGAGFPVYKAKGAKLQRALINFFLEEADQMGYKEVLPPIVVNADSGYGTGQLPDKEGQMYHVTADNLYLIPTAEVPITNIFRDVIVNPLDFPIKYVGYTPCFRREAGSYGKDVKGLNRLHQFDKVEIVQVQHPDHSYDTLQEMVNYVETLLQKLELPYRILRLCGGDTSFTSALTFDFEVYSAAQERWLEVSSVSNFEEYQSNRLKLRFKDKETKKTMPAHTLNGSALALPRIVAALLENNQTKAGIKIPKALQKYTGFEILD
jgi:seryl-tRNA synthetase